MPDRELPRPTDADVVRIRTPLARGLAFLSAVVDLLGLYDDWRLDGDVHEHEAVEGHPIGGGVH